MPITKTGSHSRTENEMPLLHMKDIEELVNLNHVKFTVKFSCTLVYSSASFNGTEAFVREKI